MALQIKIPPHCNPEHGDFHVYRSVCTKTGQYYIGKSHFSSSNFKNYVGSAKAIRSVREEHGLDSMVKEILINTDDEDIAFDLETAIINEVIDDPLCLNKNAGTMGAQAGRKGRIAGEKHHFHGKTRPDHAEWMRKNHPTKKRKGPITYSVETRRKMSEDAKNRYWATDGTRNRRIRIGDPIPEGFRKGITRARKEHATN